MLAQSKAEELARARAAVRSGAGPDHTGAGPGRTNARHRSRAPTRSWGPRTRISSATTGSTTATSAPSPGARWTRPRAASTPPRPRSNAAKANVTGAQIQRGGGARRRSESTQAMLEAAAQATVAANEAAVHDAERELSAMPTITAPTDGRIGNKNIETGNRVPVGQAIYAVVEPDLWVHRQFQGNAAHADARRAARGVDHRRGRRAGHSPAGWTASAPRQGRSSRCCRRITPRAISRRSSSACR